LEDPFPGRLDLPLHIQGTAFQRRVWLALQEIPPGETASYAEIASRIGNPKAARAVALACAANPIAVAIPCHRVVRANGQLGGYRWGVERKRVLLERERKGSRKSTAMVKRRTVSEAPRAPARGDRDGDPKKAQRIRA